MEVISPTGKSHRNVVVERNKGAEGSIKRRRKSKTRISWGDLCTEVRTSFFRPFFCCLCSISDCHPEGVLILAFNTPRIVPLAARRSRRSFRRGLAIGQPVCFCLTSLALPFDFFSATFIDLHTLCLPSHPENTDLVESYSSFGWNVALLPHVYEPKAEFYCW